MLAVKPENPLIFPVEKNETKKPEP